jgi:predicted glycoside hydrolase/deacetylase ChbG (UPF0249 family)
MSVLERLGLDGKRVLIIHHDDLGLMRAQNQAYRDLSRYPTGSIMMPSAWAAEWIDHTGGDLGVHLTLTSEWAAPRWRPLTGGASLRDTHGYLWADLEKAWQQMDAVEVEAEMRAQIDAALAHGIDVTHIYTHMGAILRPDLAQIYHRLALEYRLLSPSKRADRVCVGDR